MDEMYEMIELTDTELDAVAAGQQNITFDDIVQYNNAVAVGFLSVNALNLNINV
jgi:hypothetical protein